MSFWVVPRCLTEDLQEENRLPEDNFSLVPKNGYLSTSITVGVRAVNPLPWYWLVDRDPDSGLQESLLLFNRFSMLKWIWNEMHLDCGLRSAIKFEIPVDCTQNTYRISIQIWNHTWGRSMSKLGTYQGPAKDDIRIRGCLRYESEILSKKSKIRTQCVQKQTI